MLVCLRGVSVHAWSISPNSTLLPTVLAITALCAWHVASEDSWPSNRNHLALSAIQPSCVLCTVSALTLQTLDSDQQAAG